MERQVIIVGDEQRVKQAPRAASPERLWFMAAVLGVLFVAASAVDVAIGLWPADWSLPVGRFAAVSASASALPLLSVGAALICVSGLMTMSRSRLLVGGGLSALVVLAILVALVVLAGSWGGTIGSVVEAAKQDARDRMLRSTVFLSLFGIVFGFCAGTALSAAGKASTPVENTPR